MDTQEVINVISSGNVKMFKRLTKDVEPSTILNTFMLHFVENENINCLKFFIKKHPELINEQNNYIEYTLLHYAVKNSYEATSFLLDKGANIHIKNVYKKSPILEFFEDYYFENHYNILELIINRGANLKDVDEDGNGPLHLFARNVKGPNLELEIANKNAETDIYQDMFNLLVKSGGRMFLKNNEGDTPLMHLVKSEGYEGCNYELSKIFEGWIINNFNKK